MKLECWVTSVEKIGSKLHVSLRGWAITEPEGVSGVPQILQIPADQRSQRAFHAGRRIMIEVKPVGDIA